MESIRSHSAVVALAWLVLLADSKGAVTHYVSRTNTSPLSPFLTWAAAATNIQDALDVAAVGDTVLVGDGLYASGGRAVHATMTNRAAVVRAVRLLSANGPGVTVVTGQGVMRCVYLASGAVLSGFTLTNGNAGTI